MKRRSSCERDFRRRGVVLAETAIVLLLLCTITLGALQYGWFFYALHTATNAARQGARTACTLDGTVAEGRAASERALGVFFTAGANVTLVSSTVDGKEQLEVTVVLAREKSELMPVAFLPVPQCQGRVTMAKEGT